MARLDSICKLNMGQSPDSSSYNENGKGMPFFQGNADFGVVHPTVRVWCDAPTKIAHNGDILISVRAPIGALNIADTECCIGRGLAALTVDETVCDKQYLWYGIASKVDELNSKGTGSTFKAISKNVLAETQIPLPTIDMQRQIALKLDNVCNLISLRKQQLSKLDELVKSRFIEMFGEPITNSKCLPTHALGKVLLLKAGDFTAASDIVAEPTIENIYPCYGGNGIRGYVAEYNQEGEYSLIGRQGALSGNVQYAKGKFKNTEHALLVTPLIDMNSIWLNNLLINLDLKRYQTGAAQPGLSVKNLQEIPIIEVPKEEQNKFAAFVEQTDKSKFEIQKERST